MKPPSYQTFEDTGPNGERIKRTVRSAYDPATGSFAETDIGSASIPEAPRNIDPLSEQGVRAQMEVERQKAALRPRGDGTSADKASNYDIVQTADGMVRINKLTGEATPITSATGGSIQKLDTTVNKAPNNEQANAAGFAARMLSAGQEMDRLTNKERYDPTNARDQIAGWQGGYAGNKLMSNEGQQFQQAAQNWVRANLRKESGAAIAKDEMANEIANYFPRAGDTKETVEQKARNRKIVEEAMIRTAGPAWDGSAITTPETDAFNAGREAAAGSYGDAPGSRKSGRQIVRTGRDSQGNRVAEYDDGSVEVL